MNNFRKQHAETKVYSFYRYIILGILDLFLIFWDKIWEQLVNLVEHLAAEDRSIFPFGDQKRAQRDKILYSDNPNGHKCDCKINSTLVLSFENNFTHY